MTWHADDDTIVAYARGAVSDPLAMSVEAHLVSCAVCRARVPIDRARLDRVWQGVRARAALSEPGLVERILRALQVPGHVARLLAATPALSRSWLLAVVFAVTFAVAAAHATDAGHLVFLVVSPLLPLAGVAAAFGPGIDPVHEIGVSAPMRSGRLLGIRAIAVLAVSMTIVGAGAASLPSGSGAALWLLPSIALAAAGLASATTVRPLAGVAIVAAVWIGAAVAAAERSGDPLRIARADGQIVFGVIAVVAAVGVWLRSGSFDGSPARRQREMGGRR